MGTVKKQTPMMEQYWEYRRSLPKDTLLLFRLGDFYEMFHDDAVEGARLLGITLTKRNDYPMAGIPHHAAEAYVNKLLSIGKKVAICEQVETPKAGKLVKRALSRILTPGTALEDNQLDPSSNHYLLALNFDKQGMHAAWLDLSTGDFRISSDFAPSNLLPALHAIGPKEIIVPEDAYCHWRSNSAWYEQLEPLLDRTSVSYLPDYHFEHSSGLQTVTDALGVINLDGFGITRDHAAIGTAGAVVYYATDSAK